MSDETKKVSENTKDAPTEAIADAPVEKPAKPKAEPKPSRTAPPLPAGACFLWGTGRRKKAVARVRIAPGEGKFLVNKREMPVYFPHMKDQETALSPLETLGMLKSYDVCVNVSGGGGTGQSGAVALGLARALARHMPEVERDLRNKGLLTRDARAKERKKPGQPGARKRFQFSKR